MGIGFHDVVGLANGHTVDQVHVFQEEYGGLSTDRST